MAEARAIPEETRLAQARASNPTASAWVSANAGSGKTHVLINRVIRLMLAGTPPERILCLTFTRAAAAQMQTLGDNAEIVSEDGLFRTRGSVGGNCVNASMSDDLAYELTKAHLETLDALYAKAPYATNIGLEELDPQKSGMCGLNPIKYHAGAIRAWEEAGYTLPDCAK